MRKASSQRSRHERAMLAYPSTSRSTRKWGDRTNALEWLDTAMRLRDSGLEFMKTDPLLDPLRKEPRFQEVMRELKFPD